MIGKLHNCARDGHDWVDAPQLAIVERRCCHCPAIGARCPECSGSGGTLSFDESRWTNCVRCRATGTIELVEVAAGELERLRLTDRRFAWLLREFAHTTHADERGLLKEIDALIGIGASCGRIQGVPTAELARLERTKKPSTGSHRSRASRDTPESVPSESTIAENRQIP